MTTTYPNRESAVAMGFHYAGRDDIDHKDHDSYTNSKGTVNQFGCEYKGDLFTLNNSNGKEVHFIVEGENGRYFLWLLADDGMALRT